MINYDKDIIKQELQNEDIFQLLIDFGGEPEYSNFGIISATICHNRPGEGSRKLYFYQNSQLFICFTGCEEPHFDIFELVRKVAKIQWNEEYDLNDAVRWIARRFGIAGIDEEGEKADQLEDWKIFAESEEKKNDRKEKSLNSIILKSYNQSILDRFNYKIKITPWLEEGITQEVLDFAKIGFYPGGNQIIIPHYDMDGNLIGIRGRTLSEEDAEAFGKYRPIKINKQLYNHPLGYTLYGLNWAKDNIKKTRTALIVESEKSVLKYMSYFGIENNICVAVCGSSLSNFQMQELLDIGAQNIIIGFDRQYEKIGNEEYHRWVKKLKHISNKYKNQCRINFLFDTKERLGYKDSPLDKGKEVFLELKNEMLDEDGKNVKDAIYTKRTYSSKRRK